MGATQIKEMRTPHDAVLDELLANPFDSLKQLSVRTGYTVSWLSTMIRSDCFQVEYERRRGDVECGVMQGITQRLQGLAHLAIDRMEETLSKDLATDDTIDAFDKVLKANGYAPNAKGTNQGGGPALQQNFFMVQRDELAELRGQIINGTATPVVEPLPAIEDDSSST